MADSRMTSLWSGRFDVAPDADLLAFGASFPFDRRLLEDDVAGSVAWAEALAEAGVVAPEDAHAITAALAEMLEQWRRDPSLVDGPDEDVHSFVERQLVARVGDAGRRLHTGRSRNEQVALDLRLYVRRRVRGLQSQVRDLVGALVAQAAEAGDAVMPAYTHLRRAQPVLVAHYWLAHAQALRRDHARLGAVRDEADALPLGSGAVAGTAYAIDVARLAARLGFSRVVANSIDAVADRDFVSSFLHAASLTLVHLSRLAEDVIVFGSEEFGFFDLDDRVATGSSLMPQKKNPDPMELVRGKAGRAIGHLTAWLATMKSLPSGYNKDLQEDKEAIFDAEDTLAGSLAATATVVETLALKAARAERAASGLLLATDVADYLVGKGLPFREAHRVAGRLVALLGPAGRPLASASMEELRTLSPLFDEGYYGVVELDRVVAAKISPGGTAPQRVAEQLTVARDRLEQLIPEPSATTD